MSRSATPALSYSSSTTTLITLPPSRDDLVLPPPPTKNTLAPAERARLMRSTKKIEALLGTTPHFADLPSYSPYPSYSHSHSRSSSSSTSLLPIGQSAQLRGEEERGRLREKRMRRQGSVFEVVSSDLGSFEVVPVDLPRRSMESVSSLNTSLSVQSKSKGRSKPHPEHLVLCLETRPVEACQEDVFSLPCTPTTATILGDSIKISTPLPSTTSHRPATPLSPVSPNNFTPNSRSSSTPRSRFSTYSSGSSLLFAPISTPDTPSPVRPVYTKSSSAPITPMSARFSSKPPSPSTLQGRRKKMAKLAKQFGENVPPELVFRSDDPPKSEAPRREERAQRRRSMSVDYAMTVNTFDVSSGQVVGMGVAFSSGESWVGEWNRDIKDVQKGLRALRVR